MPTLQRIAAGVQNERQQASGLFDVSVIIVSYNTRELLDECLRTLAPQRCRPRVQTLVVDNASRDGSAELVAQQYPHADLIRCHANVGFGRANNIALEAASGRYIILLNSDAFLPPDVLERAVSLMDENPGVAIGGGKLVGRDNSWQPSGRAFPSAMNHLLMVTGLSDRFRQYRFFGDFDRTWCSAEEEADVDWITGAFMIIRAPMLASVGLFDPNFFLYYEEVDLCRRAQRAGYAIRYWPELRVVHAGGASSKTVTNLDYCSFSSQLTLWSMRSSLIYFRKHHGWQAVLIYGIETAWHFLRAMFHSLRGGGNAAAFKAAQSRQMVSCMRQAWSDTNGGRISPPQPW